MPKFYFIAIAAGLASGVLHLTQALGGFSGLLLGFITTGTASPEGAVTAAKGSLFLRTDGGDDTTLYVKTSGAAATGWRAVTTAAP